MRPRAADVVYFQKAPRLPARHADVPAAPRAAEPHALAARQEGPRERHLLDRHLDGAEPALQFVSDSLMRGGEGVFFGALGRGKWGTETGIL